MTAKTPETPDTPANDPQHCAACAYELSDWQPGAACPECGSRVGPWRPVQGKSLRGRSKLLVVGWPFAVAAVSGVVLGWMTLLVDRQGGSDMAISILIYALVLVGGGVLLVALVNTAATTFFMVRHVQRRTWVPPERMAMRAAIAMLVALGAGAAGAALALGLYSVGCVMTAEAVHS